MEQAGRILRAQATRKQTFLTVLPLLTQGLIRPAQETPKGTRPATKDHQEIAKQVRALRTQQREAGEDAEAFLAMTNLLEQACNHFLQTGAFPVTYEELQEVPVLKVGQQTFAGDDGMAAGQTYRAQLELTHLCELPGRQERQEASLTLRLRSPDEGGRWAWGAWSQAIALPETVVSWLWRGASPQAPTLREIRDADGSRVVVLDLILEVPATSVSPLAQERRVLGFDWGVRSLVTASILEKTEDEERTYRQVSRPVFLNTGGIDGRQARLRRQIAELTACRDHYAQLVKEALTARDEGGTPLPAHFASWQQHVEAYETSLKECWKKYERRNRELAHLAANLLILLALLSDCKLICGEDLRTLKTIGRGRDVRGRFRNWRTNTTVRGELWRVLKYKCHLLGIRARTVEAAGTTHTCPHCGRPAKTYRSPAKADRTRAWKWAPWLCCRNPECRWNGARDYAASLNIARLGMAFLITFHHTRRYEEYRMTSPGVKPALYSSAGATLLLPSHGFTARPQEGTHICYAGWSYATSLRTSRPHKLLAILSTSQLRKVVLQRA